ncbi:hypothetical protein FACS1894184_12020 [Clostridia bacterium]|nr:hypothetical protein FACS1894184_12020 [Clostridia bacterium]
MSDKTDQNKSAPNPVSDPNDFRDPNDQLEMKSAKHGASNTRNWIIGGIALVLIVAIGGVLVWRGMSIAGTTGSAADPVVVEMKSKNILLSQVVDYYESMRVEYQSQGLDITDPNTVTDLKTDTLTAMAQRAIADDKITQLKLSAITDEDRLKAQEDAQAEYEAAIEMYSPYFQNEEGTLSNTELRAAVEEYFKGQQISLEAVTQYFLADIPTQRLLESIYKDVTVTDEDIQADFQLHVDEQKQQYENDIPGYEVGREYYGTEMLYTPAGYRGVRHILLAIPEEIQTKLDSLQNELSALSDELFNLNNPPSGATSDTPDVSPDPAATPAPTPEPDQAAIDAKTAEIEAKTAEIEAVRSGIITALEPTIQEIRDKLAAGESFGALIEQYGIDPGMKGEPAKTEGYAVHAKSILYDDAFQQGAMALQKVGDVGEPILSSFGVHILEYTRDIPEGVVELTDTLKEDFRAELIVEKQNAAIDAQFDIWMKDYSVVIHPELLPD